MSDFAETWLLVRKRFDDAVDGLSAEQLNWRMHDHALTIGEMCIHVAGVEVSFISQLLDLELDEFMVRVKSAATDGAVNDNPFPFTASEITPEVTGRALKLAREMADPVITNPSEAVLAKKIVSALGPVVDGRGALARLAYHPGYHQGQAYLVKTAPGFPA